jgi:hypothetical protein
MSAKLISDRGAQSRNLEQNYLIKESESYMASHLHSFTTSLSYHGIAFNNTRQDGAQRGLPAGGDIKHRNVL